MVPALVRAWPGGSLRAMCVLALVLPLAAATQTQHDLQAGREAGLVSAGLALNGVSLLLAHGHQHAPAPVVDISHVPKMDLIATRQWSVRANRTSNWLFGLTAAVSLVVPMVGQQGQDPLIPPVIMAESSLLSAGLTNTVKQLVRRPRPYLYNAEVPASARRAREDQLSFWSGHTANMASITFSAACMVQRSDASAEARTATWIGAAIAPAAMGYLRVRAGRHFPTDVLTGYLVGALVGIVVPYFHRLDEPGGIP